jgi:SUKH-4 immunity protein of toxin-antitoxin system
MTAKQFKKAWVEHDDNLSPISAQRLGKLGLSKHTFEFLEKAGLPEDAAPFLSFCVDSDDIYYGISKLNEQYDLPETDFEKYVVIGSCSNGDPIAIDTENDEVKWLDHEDYFSSGFFNSSIYCLAECLIAYRNFVLTIIKDNGEDAFLNADFSDNHFAQLKEDLIRADERILTEKGFWHAQLEMDLAMRQDNKKN